MRPSPQRARLVLTPSLFLAVLSPLWVPGNAVAQEASTGIPADRFHPGVGPAVLLQTEGADVTARGQVSSAMSLSYARDLLRLYQRLSGVSLSEPVRGQLVTDVSCEFGVGAQIAVAVGLPVILDNDGDRLRGTGIDDAHLAAAVGDLRLRGKASFIGQPTRPGLHAAIGLELTIPMGGQSQFAATGSVTLAPRIYLDYRVGRVSVAAAVGVRFQSERALFGSSFGDEVDYAAGPIVRVWSAGDRHLLVLAEAAGAAGSGVGSRPVELRGAVRLQVERWKLDVGGGAGLDREVGAPSYRLLAVVRGLLAR
jgi:hypothetical protein